VLRESVKLFFWPVQIYIRKRAPSFYNAYSAVLAHDLWTEFGHAWLRKRLLTFALYSPTMVLCVACCSARFGFGLCPGVASSHHQS
jgi:hypothetical protein